MIPTPEQFESECMTKLHEEAAQKYLRKVERTLHGGRLLVHGRPPMGLAREIIDEKLTESGWRLITGYQNSNLVPLN